MTTLLSPAANRLDLRTRVATAVRMLNVAEVMHMSGHVSVRDPDVATTMWINSRKVSRSTVAARDIVPVDLVSGARIGAGDEAPSEFHIHRAIYNRRPDVRAIVHTHPDMVVALSVAGITLKPVHVTGGFLAEETPVFDDPNLINTAERGEAVARVLGEGPAVVLRGHGIVIVADDIEAVVARTVCAEENAKLQYTAASVGTPKTLRGEELAIAKYDWCRPVIMRKHWHYHEETARQRGALAGVEVAE